jgi:Cdc6-like AAA superfamily ATPase
MAEALKDQMGRPDMDELSFEERFGLVADPDISFGRTMRMKRLLENAKLKLSASLEEIDYRSPRGLDKSIVLRLGSCDWIRKHQNGIIAGPTGTGKTQAPEQVATFDHTRRPISPEYALSVGGWLVSMFSY